MSLHPIVLSFMIFWFAVLLLMGGGVWASMLKQGDWQPVALVPLGVIAFGGLLTSVAFTLEARKARALLVKLIAPSSVSPRAPSAIA